MREVGKDTMKTSLSIRVLICVLLTIGGILLGSSWRQAEEHMSSKKTWHIGSTYEEVLRVEGKPLSITYEITDETSEKGITTKTISTIVKYFDLDDWGSTITFTHGKANSYVDGHNKLSNKETD